MNVHSTSNTPPPYSRDLLSSALGKQVCGSHDGERFYPGPGPPAGEDREDRWNLKEVEAGREDDENEETEGNGGRDDGDTPLLPHSTKKRPLSSSKGKRRRFSSPFTSDEDTATGDESDISSYTSSRPHRPSRPRPTSSDSIGFEKDTCDDGKMEPGGERSRMAVIYEQQSWEGEIVERKRYEARAWKASQAIPHGMGTVLGRRRTSHCAGFGRRMKGAKGVERSALTSLHSFINIKLLAGKCRTQVLAEVSWA